MQTPRLYRVILPVADIERAAAFYGVVFDTPGQRVSPGRHYFRCGSTILACYDPVADGDGEQGGWHFHPLQYLYFAVPDLEGVLARVQSAGGTIEGLKVASRRCLGASACFTFVTRSAAISALWMSAHFSQVSV